MEVIKVMNYVYLSPHFPPNFYNFCVNLKMMGVNVLGLADEQYSNLRPELQTALNEYYCVGNMHHYDELIKALGYFTHKYGKIDRIDSHNEYWLEIESNLRTDFNIPGVKASEILDMKCKSRMKKIFMNAGVNVARGVIVHTFDEGKRFISEVGYPVVVKPDNGVGAANTYRINNVHELENFFNNKPDCVYIMEEFIHGQMLTFDGLVDKNGNLVFYTSHTYNKGIMEAVNEDDHVYYYSYRDIPADLEDAGRKIIKAFNLRERLFHFEFFRSDKDQKIVALEVNMRPPGGLTCDMFNFANDIDIYREWANIVVHNKFSATYNRPYHCCYIGRKFRKNYRHTHEQIIEAFDSYIPHHEQINGVFSAALGDYGYLARAHTLDEIKAIVDYIHAEN